MCADHRRHIDQRHIRQVGLVVLQQLSGAMLRIGMEDDQALEPALFL